VVKLLRLFKKKKVATFREVLEQMKDQIKTDELNCNFYIYDNVKIYPWESNRLFKAGDEIKVIEFYLNKDGIMLRNSFAHIVKITE
jgi:hypothetical protein